MSRNWRIHNEEAVFSMSFAVVGWVDVFTRKEYRDIFIESLEYCQKNKGLRLFGWCLMSNHFHMICCAEDGLKMSSILRDLKKFTSKEIIKAIEKNPQESRKVPIALERMLATFKNAGEHNGNKKNYQFWRQDNMPVELFSPVAMDRKLDYIHNNSVEAGIVERPEDYIYSSAKFYAAEKGLLDIEEI